MKLAALALLFALASPGAALQHKHHVKRWIVVASVAAVGAIAAGYELSHEDQSSFKPGKPKAILCGGCATAAR